MPDLQAHSPAMGQGDGEKWTAAVDLQPTIPKSDRLLAADQVQQLAECLVVNADLAQVVVSQLRVIARGAVAAARV